MQRRPITSIALSLALACVLAGCQSVPEQQGFLEREAAHAKLTSHQLRVMVSEYVLHFADRMEISADHIFASTTDPQIQRNALLLKINGINACFQAATRDDPLGAYLDVWILNRQMIYLLEAPANQHLFGPHQSIALQECRALERRLQHIHQSIGKLPLGEEFVMQFASDFPLRSLYFDREPVASRYIEEVREQAKELFDVVANLDDNLDDMKKLSVLYAEYLPKLARWEAELFLINSTQHAALQRPMQDVTLAAGAVARIAHVTESAPQLLERERHALQQVVADERQQTLRELERMRADTVKQMEGERAVVLDAVREERALVLDALSSERETVTGELRAEMRRTVEATDEITRRRADELLERAPQLIDHFFLRIGQLCCALAVLVTIVWFVRRFLRQRSDVAATLPIPTREPTLAPADHEHDRAA